MNDRDQEHIKKYVEMLGNFSHRRITAPAFEDEFLRTRRADPYLLAGMFEEDINIILSILMSDVDQYCSYPELRDEESLDDDQLLQRARLALEKLNSL